MQTSLQTIIQNIRKSIEIARVHSVFKQTEVSLIAVSKTKPIEQIMEVYNEGQRDFGENYVDELIQKSQQLPKDIRWHFIGHLQSNKVNQLLKVENIHMIHSVDSEKLAAKINKNCSNQGRMMNILVQIKVQDSDTKTGIEEKDVLELVQKILNQYQNLVFRGFMAIGQEGDLSVFDKLVKIKKDITTQLNLNPVDIQLSMGMSADFIEAIHHGSTMVRVGSLIFGQRNYEKKITIQP